MKNISLSILVAVSMALVSCGTGSYSANSNGGYMNSIYYTSSDAVPTASQAETAQPASDVRHLKAKTVASFNTGNVFSAYTDTIFVGDENIVNVEYNPETSYVIVDDDESYEARLKKFDSPTYVVNVVIDPFDLAWYNPFSWNWDYHYYRYRYGYHSSIWWNDWRYWRWGGLDPWGYGWRWYDRYWYSYSYWWPYWGSWHDPWYYASYYRPYHHPHHYGPGHWGDGPGARPHHKPGRYYTRRGSINDRSGVMGRNNSTVTPNRSATMPRAVGSSYRRTPSVGNVRAGGTSPNRGAAVNRNAAVSRSSSANRNAAISRSSSSNRNAAVSRSSSPNRNAAVSRTNTPGSVRYGNSTGTVSSRNSSSGNRGAVSTSRSNGGTVYRQSSTSSGRPSNSGIRSSSSRNTGYSNSGRSSGSSRSSASYSSSSGSRYSGSSYSGNSGSSGSSRSSGSYSGSSGSSRSGGGSSGGSGSSSGSSTRR